MLKVLKYDWKNAWNSVKLLLLAAVLLSVIVGLLFGFVGQGFRFDSQMFGFEGEQKFDKVIAVSSLVWVSVMIALFVLTVKAIIYNLNDTMFGSGGYFTHTLPVETWELLAGKALGTWLFGVFMVIAAVVCFLLLSISLIAGSGETFEVLKMIISSLPKLGSNELMQMLSGAKYIIYGLASFLIWSLICVIQVQFICIASRQFGKYHVAGGVIIFVILLRLEGMVADAISAGFVAALLAAVACFFAGQWLLRRRLSV